MIVFKLCKTAWSLRVHRTESVSVMGHERSTAVHEFHGVGTEQHFKINRSDVSTATRSRKSL